MIKRFSLLLIPAFAIGCTGNPEQKPTEQSAATPITNTVTDKVSWQQHFTAFADAVIKNDAAALKKFIDFPIMNKGNEIWYWVNSELVMTLSDKKIKPFTEKDFDEYYSQVFSYDFRLAMKKLDIQSFFEKQDIVTPGTPMIENATVKLRAIYKADIKKIVLVLITDFSGEYSHSVANEFQFDIVDTGHIKFRMMQMQDAL